MSDSISQVIQEVVNGETLSLRKVADHAKAYRGEGTAWPSTAWRWTTQGAKSPDGRVVKQAQTVGSGAGR